MCHAACRAAVSLRTRTTQALRVGHSGLKRACRKLGMARWPFRKLASLQYMSDVIASDNARMGPQDKQVGKIRVEWFPDGQ